MRNFDESYFFNREFDIISWQRNGYNFTTDSKNKIVLPDSKRKKEYINRTNNSDRDERLIDTGRYNVQFFPESGNLVEDIISTVGLKVLRLTGHGFVSKGY